MKTANEANAESSKSDEKMEVDVQSQSLAKRKLLTQVILNFKKFYFCFNCFD